MIWALHRVADEFQDTEHGVALESDGIMADCGAMQGNDPGAFGEDEDFLGDRADELKRMAEASGYGAREVDASEIAQQERPPTSVESPKLPPPNQARIGDSMGVAGPPASEPNKRGNADAPRVDPPEKGVAIPEDTPGLATMAFPCIFQTGAADFNAERREAVSFPQRFRHILMNEEGRAMRDSRFRYWAFNTNGRKEAVKSGQAFPLQEPSAADIDLSAIAKEDKQALVNKMVAFTSKIPATPGESTRARSDIERMVDQIEWETSRRGDNGGIGSYTSPLRDANSASF